ncbi:MAG: hypothetical protein U0326_32395 [Polyangiales bacterium]
MNRSRATLLSLVLLALALRLPWLGAIPNPAGDEGNWAMLALRLSRGLDAALPPDAAFVTTAFARLIAWSFRLFGPSFASARAVLVAALALTVIAVARWCERPREALAIGLVVALHPWSVMWSRTVCVPYALALSLGVVGPLAWLDALRTRRWWSVLLASQLLGAAMHFSPLALIPIGACALWALHQRLSWRLVPVALSGFAHVVPMLVAGAGVVRGYDGRPRHHFTRFAERVYVYLRTVLGSIDGEATLRHVTGHELPLAPELLVAAAVIAVLALSARRAPDDTPPARDLSRYAALHMAIALIGLPVILSPARPWNLPAIDAERYGFVVVAPFALALGALAERRTRAHLVAWIAVAWLALVPTVRLATSLLAGGSADRGFYTLAGGGGYRGWRTPRERVAMPYLIRDEVDRLRHGGPAHVVMADYTWHPIHMVRAIGRWRWGVTDITKGPLPERIGVPHLFVVWSDGAFDPSYTPRSVVDDNDRLRAMMHTSAFAGLRRVRTFLQPDGTPLCELWAATRVAPFGR